jgi:hypothetical protein
MTTKLPCRAGFARGSDRPLVLTHLMVLPRPVKSPQDIALNSAVGAMARCGDSASFRSLHVPGASPRGKQP